MTGPEPTGSRLRVPTRIEGTGGYGLVLIHGWSCNGTVWDDLVPLLRDRFRVVTLDLPGHGLSRTRGPVTIADMAEAVAATLRGMDLAEPILVGHSMGGPVALEAAILLGRDCRLVIGIDTFTDAAFYLRRPSDEIETRVEALRTDFVATVTGMVHRITRGGPPHLAADIARMMVESDPVSMLPAFRSLLEWDITVRWRLVTCRVATINSAPLSSGATLIDLPGLAMHLMEGAGHFPMREAPQRLAALIREVAERSGAADGPLSSGGIRLPTRLDDRAAGRDAAVDGHDRARNIGGARRR